MLIEDKKHNGINYVTLDNLDARTLAMTDPELFLRTYELPLIIDEFQYAPNLLSYIKIIVDKRRFDALKNDNVQKYGLFYLTGSQIFQTMSNVTESLAGRVGMLDLYGLSTRKINCLAEDMFIPSFEILKEKV